MVDLIGEMFQELVVRERVVRAVLEHVLEKFLAIMTALSLVIFEFIHY